MSSGRVAVTCPVIIGRDGALRVIERHGTTADRRGVVTLLAAPAGMGKTRLVAEAVRAAEQAGHLVLSGECRQETGGYEPFTSALTRYERTLLPAETNLLFSGRGRAARVLLPTVFPDVPAAAETPPQLHAAVIEILRELSAYQPLTLVLEDLQWAGRDAIELLLAVAAEVPTLPVWIVGTYRPSELTAPEAFARLLTLVERRHPDEHLPLPPFGTDDVTEMLSHVFPEQEFDESFIAALHDRSDGNPFIIEELCRALLDQGRLIGGHGRDAVTAVDIPATVRAALLSRLDRVPEDTTALLTVAAVAGEELDHGLLRATTGWDPARYDRAVDAAVSVQVLAEHLDGPVPYHAFTHALTRDAILSSLDGPARRETHRRLATAIRDSGDDSRPGTVCDHLVAAGDAAVAFPHALAAARRAAARLQPGEAASRYEQALQLAPVDQELVVAVEAAEFGFYADRPRAVPLAERARRLALERDDQPHEIRALVVLARTRWITGDPDAFAPFERALRLSDGRGDALEHMVQVEAAYHLVRTGWLRDAERADELRMRAESSRHHEGDPNLRARLALVRAARASTVADLEAACAEAASLLAQAGNAWDGAGPDLLAGHHMVLFHGDLREGARRLRRHQRAWDDLTTRRPSVPFCGLAMATMWMGDGASAQALLADGYWSDSTLSAANWHEAMSQLALARGRIQEAMTHARQEIDLVDELGEPSSVVPALANLARAQLEESGLALARPTYEHALELAARSNLSYHWSFSPSYARALAAAGDLQALERVTDMVRTATAGAGHRGHDVAALRYVEGVYWSAIDQLDRARECLEDAVARYEAMPFPSRRIGASLAWASAEHRAGDTTAAVERSQQALVLARALDAPLLVQRAERLLAGFGDAGRRASTAVTGLAALTPREHEVVRLTARGLTAREVGEHLVISHRTVEGHLERARDKLGATSKADLVRLAIQGGM